MPTFYKGAGLGTHWHKNDSRRVGFTARSPEATPTMAAIITHVAAETKDSPYISLTCSYAVAWDYAMKGPRPPTSDSPAYVYEIEIADAFVSGLILRDPVKELLPTLRSVIDTNFQAEVPFYQHNGDQTFLIEVANPRILLLPKGRHPQPPGPGEPCAANLTPPFRTLVNSLRDAEILVYQDIPRHYVKRRFNVYRQDLLSLEEG